MNTVDIRIQTKDFDLQQEYQSLRQDSPHIGAIVTFTGLVREVQPQTKTDLFLEHYPGMTEKVLTSIVEQAQQRWDIMQIRIVHRIGHLSQDDQIVFVGINSPHRHDAFSACEFIMDFLKTDAPFWKKEISSSNEHWVDAKASDQHARKQWKK